ncbi:MAG: metallophosphoesterase [Clostridia bacterium]
MKKYIKSLVAVLLMLAVILGGAFVLISCDNNDDTQDKGDPIISFIREEGNTPYLTKTYADGSQCEDDFRIITFSDPHFVGDKEVAGDAVSLTLIENTLIQKKPDLVVFTGDVCLGEHTAAAIQNIGELFERYNTYWGYVLGNHDGESELGPARHELPALYSAFEHCIVDSVEGISGEGNCIVNIQNTSGKVVQSLVFIDTGDYVQEDICIDYGFEFEEGYDFIKYDQIEWYKTAMRAIADKNGTMPRSIMFTHIPLVEYGIAYDEAYKSKTVIYGGNLEPECSSPFNTGMFDAILEIGSTKAVICGHDHTNDYCVDYQGVKLLYSQSTAFNSYIMRNNELFVAIYRLNQENPPFNDGHTEFLVNMSGDITITPFLNQNNPSLFDGLSDEQRKELFLDVTLP